MTATGYLKPLLHAVVALALIAGYVTLRALGQDADALLGILAGQVGALGISHLAEQVEVARNGAPPPPPPPPPAPTNIGVVP